MQGTRDSSITQRPARGLEEPRVRFRTVTDPPKEGASLVTKSVLPSHDCPTVASSRVCVLLYTFRGFANCLRS